MFKQNKIQWGIISTARIAKKRMIKAIVNSEGHLCAAVASRDKKKAEGVVESFKKDNPEESAGFEPKCYGSYNELLDDPDIDVVYIPLPNSLHYSWVLKSAAKGKHILCEKPLAYSLTDVKKMIKVCQKNDVLLLEAQSYFLHPRFTRIFELLKNGTIGKVQLIQIYFSFPAGTEHEIRFKKALGGGCLLDLGCYGIDLIHQIENEDIAHVEVLYKNKNKVDMEFLGLFKWNNGNEAIIRVSFYHTRQQSISIYGEKGNIFVPDAFIPSGPNTSLFINTDKKRWIEDIENVDQYTLLIKEFGKQLIGKQYSEYNDRYIRNAKVLQKLLQLRN
jgi:D-xylose 1-dehydrogenase (NADP+, D-xylono-1,5-lactone-forming)